MFAAGHEYQYHLILKCNASSGEFSLKKEKHFTWCVRVLDSLSSDSGCVFAEYKMSCI